MATYSVPPAPLSLAYSASPTPIAPDWSVRIPALDGLRGIAILLVLLRHSIIGLDSSSPLVSRVFGIGKFAGSGVDLFFVLSGFLIGGILLDAQASPRYYSTFYARRAYRILPLYFAVTTLVLLRYIRIPLSIPSLAYLTFTQNFFMARAGGMGATGLLVTWSLAIEEQFYLVIPFIVRTIRGRRLAIALACMIAAVPFLRLWVHHVRILPNGGFACFALMPCRADALCLGVLSAYLVRRPAFWKGLMAHRSLLWLTTGILFAGVVFLSYPEYDVFSFRVTTWGYSVVALFYACCLLITVSSSTGIWHSALCSPWLMRLGTLAYCTYLLHFPLIQVGRHALLLLVPSHPEAAYVLGALAAVAMTLVLATLSWRFFEQPLLRRGHKYRYF